MTLTPEQAKRLNEIGALCRGYEHWESGWHHPDGCRDCDGKPPDITLSDPPTDAQKLAVLALRDEAIATDEDGYFYGLMDITVPLDIDEDGTENHWVDLEAVTVHPSEFLLAVKATVKQMRDAALRSLTEIRCPEHREERERLLGGV